MGKERGILSRLAGAVKDLIAPNLCVICGRKLINEEAAICAHCLSKLPRTGLHTQPDSFFLQKFSSTGLLVPRATGVLRYEPRGEVSRAIVEFKYHGRSRLAAELGREMAIELIPSGYFADIDALVPVPIHFTRRMRRGYNQSEMIAEGVSEVTGIPVENLLRATHSRSTQTRKSATEREKNAAKNRFRVKKGVDLSGKHLMLIDDVCTTGATIRACLNTFRRTCPDVRVSIFALSAAH